MLDGAVARADAIHLDAARLGVSRHREADRAGVWADLAQGAVDHRVAQSDLVAGSIEHPHHQSLLEGSASTGDC